MKTINFTNEKWGHAIHAETFITVKATSKIKRLLDVLFNCRRYSFLAHSIDWPNIGDSVKYKTKNGQQEAKISKVKWFRDPSDMFKIEIVIKDN